MNFPFNTEIAKFFIVFVYTGASCAMICEVDAAASAILMEGDDPMVMR